MNTTHIQLILSVFLICAIFLLLILDNKCENFELMNANYGVNLHNGIGDRLTDIIGIFTIAYYEQNIPLINWADYQIHENRIYDLRLFDFSELGQARWTTGGAPTNHSNINIDASCTLTPYNIYKSLNHDKSKTKNKNISIKDISNKMIHYATKIKPTSLIQNIIPDFLNDYIAIHLRRTDKITDSGDVTHHTNNAEYNNIIENSLRYVEDNIILNNTKFYIISDDNDYKMEYINTINKIADKYNKHIKIHTTSINDIPQDILSNYNGSYDVYELFTMCKCKLIIQCIKYSTFSMIASIISQVPLVNCHTYDKKSLINLWKPCLNLYIEKINYNHIIDIDELMITIVRCNNLNIP